MLQIFNRYYIIKHIARISRHDIYLAQHLDKPEQQVALKIFDAACLVPERTAQDFGGMTDSLRQLIHPNILTIHAVGIEEGRPYMVRDYAAGRSLRAQLESSTRPGIHEAVSIVTQIGEALAFAHGQHIIHQDIRPENIFLDDMDNPLLADFCLSPLIQEDQLESTGQAVDSYKEAGYISGVATPAVDQYALGCLLYELTTGNAPFAHTYLSPQRGEAQRLPIELVLPTRLVAQFPRSLERIILRTLAVQPQERYESVTAFLVELKRALQPEPPAFPFSHLTASILSHPANRVVEKVLSTESPSHSDVLAQDVLGELIEADVYLQDEPSSDAPNTDPRLPAIHEHEQSDVSSLISNHQGDLFSSDKMSSFPITGPVTHRDEEEQHEAVENLAEPLIQDDGYDVDDQLPFMLELPEYGQLSSAHLAPPYQETLESVQAASAQGIETGYPDPIQPDIEPRAAHASALSSQLPSLTFLSRKRSLTLLGVATALVITSTLLSPLTNPTVGEIINVSPTSIAVSLRTESSLTPTFYTQAPQKLGPPTMVALKPGSPSKTAQKPGATKTQAKPAEPSSSVHSASSDTSPEKGTTQPAVKPVVKPTATTAPHIVPIATAAPPVVSAAAPSITSGYYTIVNVFSGKVLDDTDWSTADGNLIQQWTQVDGQADQQWSLAAAGGGYYYIVNRFSGKVLDDKDWSTADGSLIQQWTEVSGQSDQQWSLVSAGNGAYYIVNVFSGKVLDDKDWSTADGASIQQWTEVSGQADQQWTLQRIS